VTHEDRAYVWSELTDFAACLNQAKVHFSNIVEALRADEGH
jgi:hypothetical protein